MMRDDVDGVDDVGDDDDDADGLNYDVTGRRFARLTLVAILRTTKKDFLF